MFALRGAPAALLKVRGLRYRLVRVFKHDFFAATCLYEMEEGAGAAACDGPRKIVVKYGRQQSFCGLPTAWIGDFHRNHEESIYRCLEGVSGVPRWVGRIGTIGYAMEYIEGRPLDHAPPPPAGFFEELRKVFDAIHQRGIVYVDSNKRSNILIGPEDKPFVIDYQISFRRRDDLPWPFSRILAGVADYFCRKDLYHLYKHKRRIAPRELTPAEEQISRRQGLLHVLHSRLTKRYRNIRRRFLKDQFAKGTLTSPTAGLEDHNQPEKESWRVDEDGD